MSNTDEPGAKAPLHDAAYLNALAREWARNNPGMSLKDAYELVLMQETISTLTGMFARAERARNDDK